MCLIFVSYIDHDGCFQFLEEVFLASIRLAYLRLPYDIWDIYSLIHNFPKLLNFSWAKIANAFIKVEVIFEYRPFFLKDKARSITE